VHNPLDPGYYGSEELRTFGFRAVGDNVRVSRDCVMIGPESIIFGNDVRIDSGTTIVATGGVAHFKGRIHIGGQCHFCVAADLTFEELSGTSQGVRIYTSTDDYSGRRMMGPMVPRDLRGARTRPIRVGKHACIGSGSVVMPGCDIAEGTVVGALSFVAHPLQPWSIYHGNPARRVRERSRGILDLEAVMIAREAAFQTDRISA
jgi:galactoside O-acetyltransferase